MIASLKVRACKHLKILKMLVCVVQSNEWGELTVKFQIVVEMYMQVVVGQSIDVEYRTT